MNKRTKSLASIAGLALLMLLVVAPSFAAKTYVKAEDGSRGYMTTPQELRKIAKKAAKGKEPFKGAVQEVMSWANRSWNFSISNNIRCSDAHDPAWIDEEGTGIVYANALAYHLTGDAKYADKATTAIKQVMKNVLAIPLEQQCRLNFAWGIPEWVASADLLENYWRGMQCDGPTSHEYNKNNIGRGDCKDLFQNWLAKNPYYIISLSASSQSNWGAAAANATAYIADYLADRPDIVLVHRHPREMLNGQNVSMNPRQAFDYANKLLFDRMNGFGVEHNGSTSCDFLSGSQQQGGSTPVKSQFSERGIIPDDARREQHCNIDRYNGEYQNYPQIHINNTVQHCELLLRRGSKKCYKNIRMDDIPNYRFVGPDGKNKTTHLRPGRGSIERVINAVIIDSGTEWNHDGALWVAYRFYVVKSRFGQVSQWKRELDRSGGCSQGICFGQLTHGFKEGKTPKFPPVTNIGKLSFNSAATAAQPLPLPPAPGS
jgi:hypothetical protein